MLKTLTEVYNSLDDLNKLFVLVLVVLVVAWFYAYYARGARHRAQLARLRMTIESLNARERQQEARYEELMRRFHSLELNVNGA